MTCFYDVGGAAASSRIVSYRPNTGEVGEDRSLERMLRWATTKGVTIPPYVRIVPLPSEFPLTCQGRRVRAKYFEAKGLAGDRPIYWEPPASGGISIVDSRSGAVIINVEEDLLDNDEAFLHVVAHEVFEIEALKGHFDEADSSRLDVERVYGIIDPSVPKNSHWFAWEHADLLIERLRGDG